jgi:hypothetical protein
MITRVKRDLSLDGSSFLSDADITEWLSEAQEIFARETRWFKFSLSLSTVVGTAEYAFPDAASAQVLTIDWVRLDDQDLWPLRTQGRLDGASWDWRDQQGTPTHWFVRGMSQIRLWPTPGTASADGLEIYGTGLPPVVSEDDEQLYCPNSYDHALLAFAKMRASEKDAHGEGARRFGKYEREWEEALRAGKLSVSQADEWAQVFLGENALMGHGPGYRQIPPFTSITAP